MYLKYKEYTVYQTNNKGYLPILGFDGVRDGLLGIPTVGFPIGFSNAPPTPPPPPLERHLIRRPR